MKREILFRGKRVDNGEWIEGNLLKFCWKTNVLTYIATIDFNPFDMERTTFRVVPETVRQFTGLRDIYGKRIFEGDIVEYPDEFGINGVSKGNVYFDVRFGEFRVLFPESYRFIMHKPLAPTIDEAVVIGNVHDNPELLKCNEDESESTHVLINYNNFEYTITEFCQRMAELERQLDSKEKKGLCNRYEPLSRKYTEKEFLEYMKREIIKKLILESII